MANLTPQVHWAQRHPELFLRVELSDVQDPNITITDNVLHFKAHGHGAKGDNIYTFQIEFLEPVNPQPVCKVTQRQLNITVKKKESHWWERLTKQEKRPLFLTPDFDRWLDESDAELELKAKEEERLNKISIKNRIPKDPFRHLKRGYLFMYNLVQFLGFSWIFVNMTVRLFMLGKDSFSDTFHMSGDVMYFCQMFALMEIINSLIGLVKAPLAPVCIQIFGRNFILFVVLGSVEEMQSKAVVFFIFYIWSMVEIIRYPYYLLSSIDIEWKILTWLRYSIWMPLVSVGNAGGSCSCDPGHSYLQQHRKIQLHPQLSAEGHHPVFHLSAAPSHLLILSTIYPFPSPLQATAATPWTQKEENALIGISFFNLPRRWVQGGGGFWALSYPFPCPR